MKMWRIIAGFSAFLTYCGAYNVRGPNGESYEIIPWYIVPSSLYVSNTGLGIDNRFINFYEDDSDDWCELFSGEIGSCQSLDTCISAQKQIQSGQTPKTCYYENFTPIVCCGASEPEVSLESRADECPPIPSWSYGDQQRTGKKAFDKCLDYMDPLFPCVEAPAGSSMKYVRADWDTCSTPSTFPVIIGGKKVILDEFPHMAALGFGEDVSNMLWSCGGSLISEEFVLTAGHCTYSTDSGNVRFVRFGDSDISLPPAPEYLYGVSQVIAHPEYNSPSKYNDIALLKLDRRVMFSASVRPACLNLDREVSDNVVATGWGATQIAGDISNTLMKVSLNIFPFSECRSFHVTNRNLKYGILDDLQICAGHYEDSKDTCQGDSGGPIQRKKPGFYCMYDIVGITSFGKACGIPGVPAVYTRVSQYVDWIESVVWP